MGIFIISLLGVVTVGRAQDAYFSQYYAAPLFLNPALTGVEQDIYFGVNHRSQWSSLEFPFTTTQFSMIFPMISPHGQHIGGLGLSFFNDVTGSSANFKTQGISLSGAYNLWLERSGNQILSMGLQAGLVQKRIDFNNLQWGAQYDPFFGFDSNIDPGTTLLEDQTSYPAINAGIVYYFNPSKKYHFVKYSFFSGVAVSYLNRPNESLVDNEQYIVPLLLKYHGGIEFRLNRNLHFAPNILIMSQNQNRFYNLGAYFNYTLRKGSSYNPKTKSADLLMGGWYQFQNAFIISTGLAYQNFMVGFSYDVDVSSLRFNTNGQAGYEISLSCRINRHDQMRRYSSPLL